MEKIKTFCCVVCVLLFAGCQHTVQDQQIVMAKLHDRSIRIEVVNTTASMAEGLSDRDTIGSEECFFYWGMKHIHIFGCTGCVLHST